VVIFPNCKINLGLHILKKREDGYHDLETIFYPVGLQDALEAVNGTSANEEIDLKITGMEINGHLQDNICVKAYELLKKDFPLLPSVQMHLHKIIPSGAGLGGGSSDGAFSLILLNKKFNLGLEESRLLNYALLLGSDCPFFIKNKPCIAKGRGEQLEEINLDLSSFKIILVHPGIHLSTAWAFSQIEPEEKRESLKTIIQLHIGEWKERLKNDFEEVAFGSYPELKNIKKQLYTQGALYASMSGSGSSFFGIFDKDSRPQLDFPSPWLVKQI
jgi:4-diphosphocytidyl-2-C-methyl-D-erythritol kinase